VLSPEGQALLPLAREIRDSARAMQAEARATNRLAIGSVRLTALEILTETVLPPILQELKTRAPELSVEVDSRPQWLDLSTGEADVALRVMTKPDGDAHIVRRIGDATWSVYCSRDYAAMHGIPESIDELADHQFVGGGGPYYAPIIDEWLDRHAKHVTPSVRYDSPNGVLAAVRAGLGLTILPCYIVDDDPNLVRCVPPDRCGRSLWLVTHQRCRDNPQVRLLMDFLAESLKQRERDLLEREESAGRDRSGLRAA
jgi:DNA-binding transcriptional LysR family regulator